MSFLNNFFDGMPNETSAEVLIADKAIAHSLRGFYLACISEGFDKEQAFALTVIMFEGMMESNEKMEDDCK